MWQVPWRWWTHEAPYDYFRYTPYGLKYLFKRAVFVDAKIDPQTGFFTTITLKLNYFCLLSIRGPKLVRVLLGAVYSVFCCVGNKLAPLLSKLYRDWALENSGYFMTAHKA